MKSGSRLPRGLKYPSTLYWPWSPRLGRRDAAHRNPGRFVDESVVVTEKIDGGNTLLHAGEVYSRSVSAPSSGKWMAMVKKHHAWKVSEPDVYLYGEDIYGVHSITYEPVAEHETFRAFALRAGDGTFAAFEDVETYAKHLAIPVVPVLFRGVFRSVTAVRGFVEHAHHEPSVLGGEREGVVLRLARRFPAQQFQDNVCKSVRVGHVQTDEHWTEKWKPCQIARHSESASSAADVKESSRPRSPPAGRAGRRLLAAAYLREWGTTSPSCQPVCTAPAWGAFSSPRFPSSDLPCRRRRPRH